MFHLLGGVHVRSAKSWSSSSATCLSCRKASSHRSLSASSRSGAIAPGRWAACGAATQVEGWRRAGSARTGVADDELGLHRLALAGHAGGLARLVEHHLHVRLGQHVRAAVHRAEPRKRLHAREMVALDASHKKTRQLLSVTSCNVSFTRLADLALMCPAHTGQWLWFDKPCIRTGPEGGLTVRVSRQKAGPAPPLHSRTMWA